MLVRDISPNTGNLDKSNIFLRKSMKRYFYAFVRPFQKYCSLIPPPQNENKTDFAVSPASRPAEISIFFFFLQSSCSLFIQIRMTIFPHTAKCKTIFPCPQPRAPRIFPITLYWLGLWAFFSRVWASDYNTNTTKVADCGCTGAVRRAGGGIADVDRNRFAINHCCFFVYAKLSHTSITRRRRRRPKSEARAKIIRGSGARKVTRAEYE